MSRRSRRIAGLSPQPPAPQPPAPQEELLSMETLNVARFITEADKNWSKRKARFIDDVNKFCRTHTIASLIQHIDQEVNDLQIRSELPTANIISFSFFIFAKQLFSVGRFWFLRREVPPPASPLATRIDNELNRLGVPAAYHNNEINPDDLERLMNSAMNDFSHWKKILEYATCVVKKFISGSEPARPILVNMI